MSKITSNTEIVRFGLVAVLGLCIDIAIAYMLAVQAGINLIVSASIGFTAGAAFNYTAHELWTFQEGARKLSGARAIRYIFILVLTLTVRLLVVELLSILLTARGMEFFILSAAAGISFFVNFAASKFTVFRNIPDNPKERLNGK